ncbi:MAG: sigma-70 family RNA polymerase sigma factor [Verrucomicrobiae bacterium]|nr:sigma-70 family RNA polymerase sigma factor [Verrucomicrobiae bacterium]
MSATERSSVREPFPPTRRSLLTKLRSWDNQESWREFFDTYWRLIYEVARKSGLDAVEAEDVVQDTILAVARQMPDFHYDPARGRFKSWLRHLTRCRIADLLRKQYRSPGERLGDPAHDSEPPTLDELPDPAADRLEAVWEEEWQQHVRAAALERIKQRVKPEHYQMFELHMLQGWPAKEVASTYGVASATVYWVCQRVSRLVKQQARDLEK